MKMFNILDMISSTTYHVNTTKSIIYYRDVFQYNYDVSITVKICASQLWEFCLFLPLAKIIYIIVIVLVHVPKPKDTISRPSL